MKFILLSLFLIVNAHAQQKIKDLTVNDLKVVSTTKGSKPCPLMTETQRNAITADNGRCVYNTTTNKLNIYNGSVWKVAGGGVDSWATSTAYAVNDLVIESNKIYKCLTAHTSGTFATDLAASRWIEVSSVDLGSVSGVLPIENGGTGSSSKNFVDLTSIQTVSGNKIFSNTGSSLGVMVTHDGSQDSLFVENVGTGRALNVSGNSQFYGSAAFNGSGIHPGAALTIWGQDKGLLLPVLGFSDISTFASPEKGMLVYHNDLDSLYTYNGSTWDSYVKEAQVTPATGILYGTLIDWNELKTKGGLYVKTLSTNTTFTFSNMTAGQVINVRLTNTASNWSVTWPTVKWPGGVTPTMTTGAKSDIYSFFYDGTNIFGASVQNY
jgi:hypothetical protein